jgi:lipopolysaccharide export system permease protein
VLISDRTDPTAPLLALAEGGRLAPAGTGQALELQLDRGEIHREEPEAKEYATARYAAATLTLGMGQALSDRNRLVGSPFELTPEAIVERAREATDAADVRRWRTFLHRRIAGPVASVAFGFLAVPIGALRRGGRAFGYAVTLLAVVLYYTLLRMGEGLSNRGALPPWLGPNLPNLATLLVGALLVARLARRGPGAAR